MPPKYKKPVDALKMGNNIIEKARQLGVKEYFIKVKVSIDDLIGKIKTLVV